MYQQFDKQVFRGNTLLKHWEYWSFNKIIPNNFKYLPDRIYAINTSLKPVIIDPIIAKWIKCDAKDLEEEFTKIREDHKKTRYYFNICIMYYINNLNEEFFPDELIEKLNLFTGKNKYIYGLFYIDKQLNIIKKCIDTEKILLACELLHRGIYVSFDDCMDLGEYGPLLYSISMADESGIKIDRSYDDSSIVNTSYISYERKVPENIYETFNCKYGNRISKQYSETIKDEETIKNYYESNCLVEIMLQMKEREEETKILDYKCNIVSIEELKKRSEHIKNDTNKLLNENENYDICIEQNMNDLLNLQECVDKRIQEINKDLQTVLQINNNSFSVKQSIIDDELLFKTNY